MSLAIIRSVRQLVTGQQCGLARPGAPDVIVRAFSRIAAAFPDESAIHMDMTGFGAEPPARLFGFLSRAAPNRVFLSIVLGALAGLAYALIIPLVTQAIATYASSEAQPMSGRAELFGFEISAPRYAAVFLALCGFILAARTGSAVLLQWVAIDATTGLRLDIYERISRLPIMELERLGPSRLHAAVANDVPAIMAGASAIPAILVNVATIAGLLGFLVYLDLQVFVFVLATLMFGVVTYRIPLFFGNRAYARARDTLDGLQEGMRGLIYGAKELKLSSARRQAFMEEELIGPEQSHRRDSRRGAMLVLAAVNYGNLISFLAIGATTFVISNRYGVEAGTLTAIAMAMLYVTGPLGAILNAINPVLRGTVALKKLNGLLREMPQEAHSGHGGARSVRQIELRGVRMSYPAAGADEFTLGPLDLTLRQGQVTFIVGGNGSGKSTLGKLLSLHYAPQEEAIYFDGELVTAENRDRWRQSIAAVYADFHLFSRVYGVSPEDLAELAPRYLRELGLAHKVALAGAQLSTTTLSTGQRKRLALLVAYLEQRDVYLFDEWAADQDPRFKEIFYLQVLPELRACGKLVIVITHDDRYYHVADSIVRMEDGRILQQHDMTAPDRAPVRGQESSASS